MKKSDVILAKELKDRSVEEVKYLLENTSKFSKKNQEAVAEQKEAMEAVLKEQNNVIEEVEANFGNPEMKENIGKTIMRQFSSIVKDLGSGMMEAIVSSEALDRHGEIISMKGLDVKEYMKNPVVVDGHDYSMPSVGRTHKLTKTSDGKLVAKFEWAKDISERAKLLYNLYKDKFQFAFSIGFIPEEVDGNTYTKSTMIEFSPVLIPANPEALLLAKKKGLDTLISASYNEGNMKFELKDILAKEVGSLTVDEIAFLKEKEAELSAEDKAKFVSVLEVKKEETPDVAKIVADAVKPLAEAIEEIKKNDPVTVKNINLNGKNGDEEATKELKFMLYVKGLQEKDMGKYLEVMGKDAMNTTDDEVLLPPQEFIAEVERLEEQYGVARRFATIRRSTNGAGIKYLLGDDDLEIFDTAEGAAKTSTKLSYAEKTMAWRKFAGILPINDELTEDSAIDLWKDATNRFARAYSRQEDILVFTQTTGVAPINPGVLGVSGVNEVVMTGDSFEDLEDEGYDILSKMIWGVPTPSEANGRFYMNREILGVVQRIKDEDGRPIWQRAMADGTPATILGKPYEVVEVMPKLSDDDVDTGFIIFGDLKYVTLGERTGMVIKIFDTGMVGDADEETQGNDLNLLTQDIQAMRAVKRMNAVVRFATAFSVAKTAGTS